MINYGKQYAEAWIKNDEGGEDISRTKYLEPALKEKINLLPENTKILDIGCGWGTVIKFLKEGHEYLGIDPAKEFFPYIKEKFPNKTLKFKTGKLPNDLDASNDFDFIICSMVLHCNPYLSESLKILFSKLKNNKKALIISFRDSAEEALRKEVYNPVIEEDKSHIKGIANLPSGIKIMGETFFYKEKEFKKYGSFSKKYLGPFFVMYEVKKK